MAVRAEVKYEGLPFDEAVTFFRDKVNVPTERWNDLWQQQHDIGFMVAGATKAELIQDLRDSVDKAIAEGTTIDDFRKDFREIVAKHGWSYNGGEGWRTRVILDTNLRTSYMAGRYQQMRDPDVLAARPNWMYKHGDSVNPRPEHLAWDGLVLPADDPWWDSHYPPNDWGCTCKVQSLSNRNLERMGKTVAAKPPDDGTYSWTDKRTGIEYSDIPKGIGPGWAYPPGQQYHYREAGKNFSEKLEQLDPDIGAAMMAENAERALPAVTLDFHTWIDDIAAGTAGETGSHRVVGAMGPDLVDALGARGLDLATAAIAIRDVDVAALVRGKGSRGKTPATDTLRHLPRAVANAQAVLYDEADSALFFVSDAPGGKNKVVVPVDVDAVVKVAGQKGKRRAHMVRGVSVMSARDVGGVVGKAELLSGEL